MLLNILDTICEEYANLFVFILNVFILAVMISTFFIVRDSRRRWNKLNDYLGDVTKTVDSVRYGNLTKKLEKMDFPDSENLTISINRMIESLHDRETMIDEFQRDLLKQNNILEKTLNSLSDGLLILDSNDKIHRATVLVTKWFGVTGKSLVGKSISDFVQIPRKKPVILWDNDEITIPSMPNFNFIASTVDLGLDDEKDKYLVVIKNITPQKELEVMKEDFVATLTHDLKVPIVAEANVIELFLNENFGPISDKQRQALKNMQTSSKELLDLVQIVLETYRLRDGKITLYRENVMLKSFINEIIEEMTPIAKKTSNTFDFSLERDICVFADKFQLKRVVKNLIQNAISYGAPKTPIKISIGEIPNYIVIKVKDHGAGISEKEAEKIFNRYYSAAKKFRKIGTGLGLYLAQQIVMAHDGTLSVESKEGEFTEFCIKIPVNYERNTIPY